MGNTIWVQVKEGPTTKGGDRDNSMMLRLEKNLDAIASKLGVTRLSDYYDYSVLEAEYSDGSGKPNELWCNAVDALASLQAIETHLREHPEDLGFKAGDTYDGSEFIGWAIGVIHREPASNRLDRSGDSGAASSPCARRNRTLCAY